MTEDDVLDAAVAMKKKVYADLVAEGAYGLDLAHSYPLGIFMRLAREGVRIEYACNDPNGGIHMIDAEGRIYEALPGNSSAHKISN